MADLRKYANNFTTTLNGAITDSATSITLTSASGLPAIGANENFNLTIYEGGVGTEIITVTDDASSPTFTVTRGVDGTSGLAFSDGALVELRIDSLSFEDVLSADESPQLRGDLDIQAHKITTTTTNGDIELDSGGLGNIIFSNDASEVGRVEDDGKVKFGTTQGFSSAGFTFMNSGSPYMCYTNSDTDSGNKISGYTIPHYTNAEQLFGLMVGRATSSENRAQIGGGTSAVNAATSIEFLAAANNTTTTGTEILRVTTSGLSFDAGSNFINDYEEGTWTPTLDFATTGDLSNAYSTQSGTYIRIGNLIFVSCNLIVTPTHTTASGELRIGGLPYSSVARCSLVIGYMDADITWPTNYTQLAMRTPASQSYAVLRAHKTATNSTNIQASNVASGNSITLEFSGVYEAS